VKSNNTYLNLLASYAYLGNAKHFCDTFFGLSKDGIINTMIDSGAFTLFNSKGSKMNWLTLDNYCSFLNNYSQYTEKYVMLDVINNHNKSKENYQAMLKRGLNPMFVFTSLDDDYTFLKEAVSNNKHLCVAGGVTTKGEWMQKRYQDVYLKTSALIHGLGFVKFPTIYQLPLHSVDSSTWIQGAQAFGHLFYFNNGLKSIAWIDILKRKKKLPIDLIERLDRYKVTPKQFSDKSNHRSSYSIETMLSIVAYIEYQKYSKKRGINLFLAVGSKSNVEDIVYVNNELDKRTLTYERYRSRKTSSC
jgi:hypothetical protein